MLSLAGCSDDGGLNLARVKGKVTYKGQPVTGADVTFLSQGGQMANGTTDAQGMFTLTTSGRPGAPIGENQVGIAKMSATAKAPKPLEQLTPDDMMRMQKEGIGGYKAEPPKSLIPERYALPATSKLTASVSENEAENEFEFNLVD
jgi:hypothetical protein